jgi:SAM-dependent methyltransferase
MRLAVRGYRVVGVDFAPSAIELARRNASELTFVVGDSLALDLPTASFDLAVGNLVLDCILGADRARFLREVARAVRPGGLLFSDTMSREGYVDFDRHQLEPTTFVSKGGNRYLVGAHELDAELAAAGFEILVREARVSSLRSGTASCAWLDGEHDAVTQSSCHWPSATSNTNRPSDALASGHASDPWLAWEPADRRYGWADGLDPLASRVV